MLLTKLHHQRDLLVTNIRANRRELKLQSELVTIQAKDAATKARATLGIVKKSRSTLSSGLTVLRFFTKRADRKNKSFLKLIPTYISFGRAIADLTKAIRDRNLPA